MEFLAPQHEDIVTRIGFVITEDFMHLVGKPAIWPAWLRTIRSDWHAFRDEPWFTELLAQIRRLPGFSEVWDSVPEGEVRLVTPLSVVPLQLHVPGNGMLQ